MNKQGLQHQQQGKQSKKRKHPTSFLDCPSLSHVVDVTQVDQNNELPATVTTAVATPLIKEIFLDRLIKEIVKPFRPLPPRESSKGGDEFLMVNGQLQKRISNDNSKKKAKRAADRDDNDTSVWRQRIRMGTNQCLKILEKSTEEDNGPAPLLMVLARDIYPPTMLAHAPALAKKRGIPVLLLPGKASSEIGQALGVRKTSILLFLPSTAAEAAPADACNEKVDSFIDFVISQIPK